MTLPLLAHVIGCKVSSFASRPDVIGAYVDTEQRDRIELVFTEAVTLSALAALSLSGVSETITSLVSGDGTSTLVLGLSAAVETTDLFHVEVAAGAVRAVGNSAPIRACSVGRTWTTAWGDLDGFTLAREASTGWSDTEGDGIVLGTLSGTPATVATAYESTSVRRYQKSEPDQEIVTAPGSNQLGALTEPSAWEFWAFGVPQSLGTNDAAHYNNEGWIGAQSTWGAAVRSGDAGADNARAQVNMLTALGAYVHAECPIELHAACAVRGRLDGGAIKARRDQEPTESSAAAGLTTESSSVLLGATSTTAGRSADWDALALVVAAANQPAHKAQGVYGTAQRRTWGAFLRPQPAFPARVFARVGELVSLYWEPCALLGYPASIGYQIASGPGTAGASAWTWTPAGGDVGAHTVTIEIVDATDGRVLRTARFAVQVIAASGAGVINPLAIGDSNIASSTVIAAMRAGLIAQGLACSPIGTKGSAPNVHEGVGGWTFLDTRTNVASPFAAGGVYDVAAYETANGAPDVYAIHFGTNDVVSYASSIQEDLTASAARMAQVVADAQALVSAIRAASSAPILIDLPLPVNARQSAFTSNYGTLIQRWGSRRIIHRETLALQAAFDRREAEGVYTIATGVLDSVGDFANDNALHPWQGLDKLGRQHAYAARWALDL